MLCKSEAGKYLTFQTKFFNSPVSINLAAVSNSKYEKLSMKVVKLWPIIFFQACKQQKGLFLAINRFQNYHLDIKIWRISKYEHNFEKLC